MKKIVPILLKHIDTFLAAALGFYFVIELTKHGGIGISPDSIMYTSVARNLTTGNGFLQFDGKPLTMFPVAFPYFLHLIMLISRQDIVSIAPYVTATLFAANIFMAGYILEKTKLPHQLYKIALLLLIITNPALLEVYTMLWSETLFIFLVLLFLLIQQQYLQSKSFKYLLFTAVIAGIAAITRYAGITLIATGCFILLFAGNGSLKKRWISSILFGSISSSFLFINLFSNFLQSGYLTGKRLPADTSFLDNLSLYGKVLGSWLGFANSGLFFSVTLGIMVIFIIGIYLITAMIYQKNNIGIITFAESFLLIYILFILISSTFSNYDDINNRLLAPVTIPFFISIGAALKQSALIQKKFVRLNSILVSIIALMALIGNLQTDATTLQNNHEAGIGGYSEDYWKESPILHFIKSTSFADTASLPIYSNDNAAIYYFTGKKMKTLPELTHKRELDLFLQTNALYVVWLNSGDNPDLIEQDEMSKIKKCIPIHSFADGTIYKCLTEEPPIIQKELNP